MTRQIIKNMPADEYHSLQRFSASGIKKILVSAQDFWTTSWMNPDRREYKSDAFNVGTAYHTRILEGYNTFNKLYAVKPECDKRTTAGKEVYRAWLTQHPAAEPIDTELYADILAAKANDIKHFKDGDAEVTVLWDDEETNVPMKSRLDYLKPRQINDLKTFSNTSGMDINRLIANHIVKYKYHVQREVYCHAMPDHEFNFIFQQTGQANNCIIRGFPSDLLLAQQGRNLMRFGINKFAECFRKFGTKAWTDEYPIEDFTDESFPLYALED